MYERICAVGLMIKCRHLVRGRIQLLGEHAQDADQKLSLFAVEFVPILTE